MSHFLPHQRSWSSDKMAMECCCKRWSGFYVYNTFFLFCPMKSWINMRCIWRVSWPTVYLPLCGCTRRLKRDLCAIMGRILLTIGKPIQHVLSLTFCVFFIWGMIIWFIDLTPDRLAGVSLDTMRSCLFIKQKAIWARTSRRLLFSRGVSPPINQLGPLIKTSRSDINFPAIWANERTTDTAYLPFTKKGK